MAIGVSVQPRSHGRDWPTSAMSHSSFFKLPAMGHSCLSFVKLNQKHSRQGFSSSLVMANRSQVELHYGRAKVYRFQPWPGRASPKLTAEINILAKLKMKDLVLILGWFNFL
ncbi:hypothetical protein NL676_033152 [Syzygium grande]|nr:hypothetical protein NL676_033152 [Syzygium grande]